MLEKARHLMTPSARSNVLPFIVMDVIAAASRIEAAGGRVVHMEVGQPAAPAPRTAIEAASGARFMRQVSGVLLCVAKVRILSPPESADR